MAMQKSQIAATAAGGSLAAVAPVHEFTAAQKCNNHGRGEHRLWCEFCCTNEGHNFIKGGRPRKWPCEIRKSLQQLQGGPWQPWHLSSILRQPEYAKFRTGLERLFTLESLLHR
jgi:hypothetical protein